MCPCCSISDHLLPHHGSHPTGIQGNIMQQLKRYRAYFHLLTYRNFLAEARRRQLPHNGPVNIRGQHEYSFLARLFPTCGQVLQAHTNTLHHNRAQSPCDSHPYVKPALPCLPQQCHYNIHTHSEPLPGNPSQLHSPPNPASALA